MKKHFIQNSSILNHCSSDNGPPHAGAAFEKKSNSRLRSAIFAILATASTTAFATTEKPANGILADSDGFWKNYVTSVSTIFSMTGVGTDIDGDGIDDDVDVDDDNDGILDSVEGLGAVIGQFTHSTAKEFRTDGIIGFATADAALNGQEFVVGVNATSGVDTSLLSAGDLVLHQMNSGEDLVAITIVSIDDGAELNAEFKGAGSSPKFEFKGVDAKGTAEESVTLDIRFFSPSDSDFAAAADLGEIALLIASGQGTAIATTTSVSIGDLDDETNRLEGVAAAASSMASFTLEENGTFTPVLEDGFYRFRGTVIDPDDNVQLNFFLVENVEIALLNDASSRAGFGLGFKQSSFDTAVSTSPNGVDPDADGIFDHNDLDSDNDGISDLYESGAALSIIAADTNQDGTVSLAEASLITGTTGDVDGDGLMDVFAATTGTTPVQSDSDDLPDYLDIDSDNDGVADTIEARLADGYVGNDDDVTDNDNDGDGVIDLFDANDVTTGDFGAAIVAGGYANFLDPVDTDADGLPDYLDLDSDDDGISELVESGLNLLGDDDDGDGIDDGVGAGYDNPDGAVDNLLTDLSNPDNDASPSHRDLDSDNDAVADADEGTNDSDGDGIPDYLDDVDNTDTDGDGIEDVFDVDDDNDGILDSEEGLGAVVGQFSHATLKEFRTDGVMGFATADASLNGQEFVVGVNATSGDDTSLLSAGDLVLHQMNSGEDLVAITVVSIDDGAELNAEFKADGSSPKFEFKGVDAKGTDEESVTLDIRFFSPNDGDFAAAADLGEIALLIAAGQGTAIATTTSVSIGDLDDETDRLEGVAASVASMASFSLEENGSFTPILENGFYKFRGTVIDPDDDVQLNFYLVDSVEIALLNDASSRAGFGLGFKQSSFDIAVATSPLGVDPDADGIYDHKDLDSDNDGISDLYESGVALSVIAADTNQDGTISIAEAAVETGTAGDVDGDGLMDLFTQTTGTVPVQSDDDSLPDYLDLDSDNDGVADTVEARRAADYVANDGDVTDNDNDGDGVIDQFDANDATTGEFGAALVTGGYINFTDPVDTDADGLPDYLDLDADGDGIPELVESGLTLLGEDDDSDGIDDGVGVSFNNPDGALNNPLTDLSNPDNDSEPSHRDLDSDGDGVSDTDEGTADSDGDGILDYLDDYFDIDTDGDGVYDDQDRDSDNDGILDTVESNVTIIGGSLKWDHNDDNGTSYAGANDAALDSYVTSLADIVFGAGLDAPTSDWEYVLTGAEATTFADAKAQDQYVEVGFVLSEGAVLNEIVHAVVPVSWGGSAAGDYEIAVEISGDNFVTASLLYDDGFLASPSGDYSLISTAVSENLQAGVAYQIRFYLFNEQNDANLANGTALPDNSLAFDDLNIKINVNLVEYVDADGDSIYDHLDLDSDNDGISDMVESGVAVSVIAADTNSDGTITVAESLAFTGTLGDAETDGLMDVFDAANGTVPVQSDSDSLADYLDLDSDNDGIADATEARATVDYVAYLGTDDAADSDDDGVLDIYDTNSAFGALSALFVAGSNAALNTDAAIDATPDYLDTDSDGDGFLDAVESGAIATAPTYTDPDGSIDNPLGASGLLNSDNVATNVDFRIPKDTDGDGVADIFDIDKDNDGILDVVESEITSIAGTIKWDHNADNGTSYAGESDTALLSYVTNMDDIVFGAGFDAPASDWEFVLTSADADTFADAKAQDEYVEVAFTLSQNATLTQVRHGMPPAAWGGSAAGDYEVAMEVSSDNFLTSTLLYDDGFLASPTSDYSSTGVALSAELQAGIAYQVRLYPFNEQNSASLADGTALPDNSLAFDDLLLDISVNLIALSDADGDSVSDHFDLDSDNDGISDLHESGVGSEVLQADTNNDGVISLSESAAATGTTGDAELDGLMDVFAAVTGTVPVHTDADRLPDYLDLDSDSDGLADTVEARPVLDYVTNDGDVSDNDLDGDGVVDQFDANDATTGDFGAEAVPGQYGNFVNPLDADADGTADYRDLDSDNDGVLEVLESGLSLFGSDSNSDGIDDGVGASYADPDGMVNAPLTDLSNPDADSQPSHRDLDADGDGILDIIEAASAQSVNVALSGVDTDGDGIDDAIDVDQTFGTDANANGIDDALEPIDTDGDNTADFLDIDSDNDGITDAIEDNLTPTLSGVDSDGDGIDDALDVDLTLGADANGNGIDDVFEATDTNADGTPDHREADSDNDGIPDAIEGVTDTDGDGIPDYLDTDSDNDGINDGVEANVTGVDADTDGIDDLFDADITGGSDTDGDGVDDALEATDTLDTDGDGFPNAEDLDSDADGIPDAIEGLDDIDADGAPDYLDTDSDNDGIDDGIEAQVSGVDANGDGIDDLYDAVSTGGVDADGNGVDDALDASDTLDTDADGIPNAEDLDADNDGIPDAIELLNDVDGDNLPDYLDIDSDNDGIADGVEAQVLSVDTDGDGIDDLYDVDATGGVDADNDGVDDAAEATDTLDSDSDGTPNAEDTDSDADGIPDAIEGLNDADADNAPDYLDTDSDNDGIDDGVEAQVLNADTDNDGIDDLYDVDVTGGADTDADGVDDATEVTDTLDTDADGIPNAEDVDSDADGIPDAMEGLFDTDGDNTADYLDTDSDNDGITDDIEAQVTGNDSDGDGIDDLYDVDATGGVDADNDGVDDALEASDTLDTDGDGIPNAEDADSDADGIPDAIELVSDADNDGIPDYLDTDSDDDGINDGVEAQLSGVDSDADDIDDTYDVDATGGSDADSDGVDDALEASDTLDSDADGQPDAEDTDSDNDGIPDAIEGLLDTDGDGTPDYLDTDSDADGIPDAVESAIDSDGDGIPDYLDIDSDNDGIADGVEAQISGTDTDGDGIDDLYDVDATGGIDTDADGVDDTLETSDTLDTDGDGTPNAEDLDTDGDGVPDAIEGLSDTDADGIPDYLDTDSDNDGIDDGVEAQVTGIDTDADGIDDLYDADVTGGVDADEDGVDDVFETSDTLDTDADGVPNAEDLDSDNDGIPDAIEGVNDADGDGVPDYLDTDSDNDAIPDGLEAQLSTTDTDGDGIDDTYDVDVTGGSDADADGVDDALEASDTLDSDNDGTPDAEDTDSDNDGIPDAIEAGDAQALTDTDGDGVPDYLDADSDNDGIDDGVEAQVTNTDTDGDGIDDLYDANATDGGVDEDQDGVDDALEASDTLDTDGDGIPNAEDADSDGDGIPDAIEGLNDADGDGVPDYLDTDSDNDGINDGVEAQLSGVDSDGDGIDDSYDVDVTGGTDADNDGVDDALELSDTLDTDGDGIPDSEDVDSDNDGIPDAIESVNDADGDGIPDYLDTDSDNDGINDGVEAQVTGVDTDGDGIDDLFDVDVTAGSDTDGDGVDDALEASDTLDTDGDGVPDAEDTDSDADGMSDTDEAGANPEMPIDTDGDGIPDHLDTDSDNDGIPDALELATDTDGDGVPDYLDTDSDNDGIPDASEAGANPEMPTDSDGDGIPDYLEPDSDFDNDGVLDIVEGLGDTDGDGIPDYLDEDADNDGIADAIEAFLDDGVTLADTDGDGVPDYLDTDSDNDGVGDLAEGSTDTDADGVANFRDLDSDDDGIFDIIEARIGMVEVAMLDENSDGTVDSLHSNGSNGMADILETEPDSGIANYILSDVDGDGVADYVDLDSDNDGIFDTIESDHEDLNLNGVIDSAVSEGEQTGDVTTSEVGLALGAGGIPRNTDADGLADFRDIDGDNDGLSDLTETSGVLFDQDGNGVVDNFVDANKDGVDDGIYVSPQAPMDDDFDNSYAAIDIDSDGDGVADLFEAGGVDANDDGLVDNFQDNDLDGLDDGIAVLPLPITNSDDDKIPNYQDTDSDNDGISDLIETGGIDEDGDGFADSLTKASLLSDTDGDGVLDYLQSNLDVPGAPAAANVGGSVHTGLAGNGCSVGSTSRVDPMFIMMLMLALLSIVRTHGRTRRDS